MIRRISIASVVLLVAVVGACGDGSTSAERSRSDDDPNGPVDDGYFPGTGSTAIDVVAYDVAATVAIDGEDHLDAVAELTVRATEDLERFELDLTGLDVDEVLVDGEPATFESADSTLVVTPVAPIDRGATFSTTVTYGGEPAGDRDAVEILEGGGGWLDLGGYSAVVAEPIGASTWLPSNDLPSDKATFDLEVTVPTPLDAVSNGLLQGRTTDSERGTTTFTWRAEEPMAPYLMTLVVGELELTDSTLPDGTVLIDAVAPDTDTSVRSQLARFPEMVSFLEQRLGAYPFSAAGNVVVPDMPSTALETQTRSVLSLEAMQAPDADQLLVHELAHQWFGDSVTPRTWADVWLNEGPAVYLQWTWAAAQGGPTVDASARASYDPDDPALDVAPADPGQDELFGTSVYERSAMFLVELQHLMGAEDFDRLLRDWLEAHAGATGTTDEFVELAGKVHGEPITDLSDPWLYGDELPPLSF